MRLIRDNVERIAVTEAQAERLKAEGFKPLENRTEQPSTEKKEKQLDKMAVSELRALAKEKGMEGYSSLSKDELFSILKGVI